MKTQLAELQAAIKTLTQKLADAGKGCYGCVDGGDDEDCILLYEKPGGDTPVARARKGKWLKLAHPRTPVSVPTPQGTRLDMWHTVHVVDGDSGEFAVYYAADKTPAGNRSFSKFDMYKTE